MENSKISAHVNITNPETLGYPYLESIKSFANFCSEVVVVDGRSTDDSLRKINKLPRTRIVRGEEWKRDFDWEIIGRNKNIGFKSCKENLVMGFDADYVFHEKHVEKLKKEVSALKKHQPVIFIGKLNILTKKRAVPKKEMPVLVSREYNDRIGYGRPEKGGTFLVPILIEGEDEKGYYGMGLDSDNAPVVRSGVKLHVYDFTFMTMEQIKEQRYRFGRALQKYHNKKTQTKEIYWRQFLKRKQNRKKQSIYFNSHSRFIQDKLNRLTPEQWGYNNFKLI